MVIPINYRKSAEGSIASYDYFDIAEGTGILTLYGATTTTGAILTKNIVYSTTIEESGAGSAPSQTFELSPFNLPKIISGTAYINVTMEADSVSTPYTAYLVFQFYKNSDTLGSATSGAVLTAASEYKTGLYSVAIPETNFKKGDVLKLEVTMVDSASNGHLAWGHDPKNRDGTYITPTTTETTTQLVVNVPFKIDI